MKLSQSLYFTLIALATIVNAYAKSYEFTANPVDIYSSSDLQKARELLSEDIDIQKQSYPNITFCSEINFTLETRSESHQIVSASQLCSDTVLPIMEIMPFWGQEVAMANGIFYRAERVAKREAIRKAKEKTLLECHNAGYAHCEVVIAHANCRRGTSLHRRAGSFFSAICSSTVRVMGRLHP